MAVFKKTNTDEAEAAMDAVKGSKLWSPPAGEDGGWKRTRIRILPARPDHPRNYFWEWFPVHGGLPGAGYAVICPAKANDEDCPACNMGNALNNAGKKNEAAKFWPSWRAAMNVVVLNRDGTLPDGQVVIKTWAPGKDLMENLQSSIKEVIEDKTKRDITDVETGHDVIVRRKGKGVKDTRYEIAVVELASPLNERVVEFVEEDETRLHDLTKTYASVTAERIDGYLTAPTRKALPSPKDPFEDEDEDDDDDDDDAIDGSYTVVDDDDEDEPEPEPVKIRKARPSAGDKDAKQEEARSRLQARLGQKKDDDDDEDEDDD